ncbi:hypothetical protein [Phreatobacter oligotrophus]|uniref:hypothetical protein n=1 Tax=Phreatobacter oligotrophus TaxID=1122261 RepID=UPI002356CA8B|nr:hypothetical protein [Phreatobacter oligotrophus]MBX9989348.1 hypothetical protein [Phreatobacter oligotrophus]
MATQSPTGNVPDAPDEDSNNDSRLRLLIVFTSKTACDSLLENNEQASQSTDSQ